MLCMQKGQLYHNLYQYNQDLYNHNIMHHGGDQSYHSDSVNSFLKLGFLAPNLGQSKSSQGRAAQISTDLSFDLRLRNRS